MNSTEQHTSDQAKDVIDLLRERTADVRPSYDRRILPSGPLTAEDIPSEIAAHLMGVDAKNPPEYWGYTSELHVCLDAATKQDRHTGLLGFVAINLYDPLAAMGKGVTHRLMYHATTKDGTTHELRRRTSDSLAVNALARRLLKPTATLDAAAALEITAEAGAKLIFGLHETDEMGLSVVTAPEADQVLDFIRDFQPVAPQQ